MYICTISALSRMLGAPYQPCHYRKLLLLEVVFFCLFFLRICIYYAKYSFAIFDMNENVFVCSSYFFFLCVIHFDAWARFKRIDSLLICNRMMETILWNGRLSYHWNWNEDYVGVRRHLFTGFNKERHKYVQIDVVVILYFLWIRHILFYAWWTNVLRNGCCCCYFFFFLLFGSLWVVYFVWCILICCCLSARQIFRCFFFVFNEMEINKRRHGISIKLMNH